MSARVWLLWRTAHMFPLRELDVLDARPSLNKLRNVLQLVTTWEWRAGSIRQTDWRGGTS